MAIHQAPGVLAVSVDYRTQIATIGAERGRPAPRTEILAALRAIGYGGKFVDDTPTVSKVEEH
jgi:hypothetical protein